MSNRFILYMTVGVILGIAVLLSINLFYTLQGNPIGETYLKYNFVRGAAVEHEGKLYTLNFAQQNAFIQNINKAIQTSDIKSTSDTKPEISKIVVYQFNGPDIVLTPVNYDEDILFSAPQLSTTKYLKDISRGQLRTLISQTYN